MIEFTSNLDVGYRVGDSVKVRYDPERARAMRGSTQPGPRSDPESLNRASQEPGNHTPALGQAACPPAGWVSSDTGQRSR